MIAQRNVDTKATTLTVQK